MTIKILGSNCPKCKQLFENVKKAIDQTGKNVDVIKVDNIDEIMNYGVMMTPALVVDEVVKSVGKVLTVEEIKKFLVD